MTSRRALEAAEALSAYIKAAGGSLFTLRNSFQPRPSKPMTEADKALFTALYNRSRNDLFGERTAEGTASLKNFS